MGDIMRPKRDSSQVATRERPQTRDDTDGDNSLGRLRHNPLGGFHFYRRKVIAGFIVDFYCRQANVAIEVDGGIHERQIEYDAERDLVLASPGVRVLRVHNDDIATSLGTVLAAISNACLETSSPLPHMREGG